ncbi:oxidoreductase UcpA [Xylogone sp. PMI_703]|nr:oxidoreductase UcpA [Xylogone sp. PMI_703]
MALLKGTALITGAGSGIGRATAQSYARAGCSNLSIADLNASGLRETAGLIKDEFPNVKILEISTDVSDPASVTLMVDQTVKTFGGLDYAANVAGVSLVNYTEVAADYDLSEYDSVQAINARGILLCMQAEVKAMLTQTPTVTSLPISDRRAQRGSIVNIASTCGLSAIPAIMPYVASKHAVVGLTRSFAIDHSRDGIRINAICPGFVETPMLLQRKQLTSALSPESGALRQIVDPPLGRLALPEEIGDICVLLSSSLSSYIHGSMIMADGGKMAEY